MKKIQLITLVTSLIINGAALADELITSFFNDFSTTTLDSAKWTVVKNGNGDGTVSFSDGAVNLSCGASIVTQGKHIFSSNKIIIESRFAGMGGMRDSKILLIDISNGDWIGFADTNYRGWGVTITGTGDFNFDPNFDDGKIGASANIYKEYRLTINGSLLTVERGDNLSNITETRTITLSNSIAGKRFYLLLGTGGPDYCPATFDWVKVKETVVNQSPTITSFTAIPKTGNPPLTVNFNVAANDPDGSIVAYKWDFDGNGRVDSTTTIRSIEYTYSDLGIFNAKVTILDNKGSKVVSKPIPITVAYGPDLVGKVETYDFSDATNTIHVDFKISNTGKIPTPDFNVRFHLSNNGKTLLPAFKEMTVSGGLGVEASTVLSVDNTFEDSIYGKYVFVIIDPTKQVAEIDETNNGTRIVIQPVATK